MRESIKTFLDYYKDTSYFYNDWRAYRNLVNMLNAVIKDVADYCGGYGCTKSLELEADIIREFLIEECSEHEK